MDLSEREDPDLGITGMSKVVERNDLLSSQELLRVYNIKINKNKLLFLFSQGYVIDYISISKSADYPKELTEEGLKTCQSLVHLIFKMQSVKEALERKKKTISIYGVRYKKSFYYFTFLSFRLKDKKRYIKPNFEEILNLVDSPFPIKIIRPDIDLKTRLEVFKRDNYVCQYCGHQNGINGTREKILSVDHIIPRAYGGTNKIENLRTCCLDCNVKKNDKIIIDDIKKWFIEKEWLKDKQMSSHNLEFTREQQSEGCSVS